MKPFLLTLVIASAVALGADIPPAQQIQPKDVAAKIASDSKPAIFQVGPNVLYRSNHIPASIFAGPGNKQEGIDLLKAAVAKMPKDQEIILYCGCCPWDRCPNINPAIQALRAMGYTKVKAMYVAQNFKVDWVDHGYPIEKALQQ